MIARLEDQRQITIVYKEREYLRALNRLGNCWEQKSHAMFTFIIQEVI